MVKKKRARRKSRFWPWVGRGIAMFVRTTLGLLWEIVKLPYYLVVLLGRIGKKVEKEVEVKHVEKKRSSMPAKYSAFSVIETIEGDYKTWEKKVQTSESTIGVILGARGSGKTAFGVKVLENIEAKTGKKMYAMGFPASEMPSWITVVDNVNQIENDSVVLIDEGGILFSSRNAMTKPNKLLSQLMLIARHKNISILFISQNSSNLEVNILRQADYMILKPSSLLQKDFERKIVQKLYEDTSVKFSKYKDKKGITYIHSSEFRGFITNPLPSFWKQEISKAFR